MELCDYYLKYMNALCEGTLAAPEGKAAAAMGLEDKIISAAENRVKKPEWYILDRESNVSFVSLKANAEKVNSIAKVFPVFFFAVAALVALTTMTRMVDEERTEIGTLKALGFSSRAIAAKYLLYAGAAAVTGGFFGLALGLYLFPTVIINVYRIMYRLPEIHLSFNAPISLGALTAAVICILAATLWAVIAALRENPAALMLPKAPKSGKRILLERVGFIWRRMKFTHKVTARNLFRYKKRLFMMLLGVAGSVFFAQPLAAAFGLGSAGPGIVPLLFLNAALYMLVRYLNVLLRLENDLRAYTAETLWMQGCYNLFYLLPGFFTSNVFVLAVAAILSFGVVAIAFGYKYRAAVFAPLPGAQLGGIARQTVPYGVALAPAQILFSLSSGICLSFVGNASGENAQGLFAFGYSLAQLVTAIQAGFSTYWGPYVYSHYRDEQERICRVHDVLNLLIFGFFCVLVMFEDIVFVIFPDKRGCLAIFPLLMLAVVFNILCEGTVYGNSIARKPWHDTIGIGLGALSNFGLCALLVPAFGLTGAALALAASNGLAFLYRSITGQMYYRTVASYPKTISGFLLAFAVTAIGTLLWQHFFIKFALVGVILFIYCTLYRAQLARLWSMGLGILRGIFHRK